MRSVFSVFICAAVLVSASSCSLKYSNETHNAESSVPEFVFEGAKFNRYENKTRTVNMNASRIEQYSGGRETYAKNVSFMIWKNDGTLDTEGSCGLLASNSKTEQYELYDKIEITSHLRDILISAGSLRWNGKSEQLVSGRNDMITVKKGDTQLNGSGFSASGITNTFAFSGVVTGSVDTKDAAVSSAPDAVQTVQPENAPQNTGIENLDGGDER